MRVENFLGMVGVVPRQAERGAPASTSDTSDGGAPADAAPLEASRYPRSPRADAEWAIEEEKKEEGGASSGTSAGTIALVLLAGVAAVAAIGFAMSGSKGARANPARMPHGWQDWSKWEKMHNDYFDFVQWAEPAPSKSNESRYAVVWHFGLIRWARISPNPDVSPDFSGGAFYDEYHPKGAVVDAAEKAMMHKAKMRKLVGGGSRKNPAQFGHPDFGGLSEQQKLDQIEAWLSSKDDADLERIYTASQHGLKTTRVTSSASFQRSKHDLIKNELKRRGLR